MHKNFKTLVIRLIFSCFVAVNSHAQNYCENGSYGNQLMWVESVASGPFSNDSGPFNNNYGDQDHLYIGYADYSNQVINWQAGPNPLLLNPGRYNHPFLDNYPSYWQVWIDLNNDNVFAVDERVLDTASLNHPVDAVIDLSAQSINSPITTRMRVSVSFYQNAPVCGSIGHGEVEDYTVTIAPASDNTLRVPEDFTTIQAAIDAAVPGERILVNDGVYPESLLINTDNLLLESVNGYANTNISGVANAHTIWVQSRDVTIKGFDMTGPRNDFMYSLFFDQAAHGGQAIDMFCGTNTIPGTRDLGNVRILHADNIRVEGLVCDANSEHGINAFGSDNSVYINNDINGHKFTGIAIADAVEAVVHNNSLVNNGFHGLRVFDSQQITITENTCSDSGPVPNAPSGIGYGIEIRDSSAIQVINNVCLNNHRFGVLLNDVTSVELKGNSISSEVDYALVMRNVDDSLIVDNDVMGNERTLELRLADNNLITGNYFQANFAATQACQFDVNRSLENEIYLNSFLYGSNQGICSFNTSSNQWNTQEVLEYEYLGGSFGNRLGNHYSSADHSDLNGDGVSDLPFVLPGLEPQDDHSLSSESIFYMFQN